MGPVRDVVVAAVVFCFLCAGVCEAVGPHARWKSSRISRTDVSVAAHLHANALGFLEGPTWLPASKRLLATNLADNTVVYFDAEAPSSHPDGVRDLQVLATNSGAANGMLFDPSRDRLFVCQSGKRRVVSLKVADIAHLGGEEGERLTVLAERHRGEPLNSPNDLVLDRKHGILYFTDPRYGSRDSVRQRRDCVYRVKLDGGSPTCAVASLSRPNGLAMSHDGRWLYVVDNNNSAYDGDGNVIPSVDPADLRPTDETTLLHASDAGRVVMGKVRRGLLKFPIDGDGKLNQDGVELMYEFGTGRGGDGAAISMISDNYLYVAGGLNTARMATPSEDLSNPGGLYVIQTDADSPDEAVVGVIPIESDLVTNVVVAEYSVEERREILYVTAGPVIYRVEVLHRERAEADDDDDDDDAEEEDLHDEL